MKNIRNYVAVKCSKTGILSMFNKNNDKKVENDIYKFIQEEESCMR